jgi:hypothetical protein
MTIPFEQYSQLKELWVYVVWNVYRWSDLVHLAYNLSLITATNEINFSNNPDCLNPFMAIKMRTSQLANSSRNQSR